MTQACRICEQTKPVEEFHLANASTGQRRTECGACSNAIGKLPLGWTADEVLEARGLPCTGGATRGEVAAALGISLDLVEQIEQRALRKLRRKLIVAMGGP